jgi:ribosomal protein S3AE
MAVAKKRKRFFGVEIPLIGKETQMQGYEISELDGKFLSYDMTRSLKGKNMVLVSKISVKNDKASAIPKKLRLMSYFLRRMMRKGTNYVEDSFSAECKDSRVRIKPFLITRRKVPRSIRRSLRNRAREELARYLKEKNSSDVFGEIVSGQLQKSLSLFLKKTYPLSLCEIMEFRVENKK